MSFYEQNSISRSGTRLSGSFLYNLTFNLPADACASPMDFAFSAEAFLQIAQLFGPGLQNHQLDYCRTVRRYCHLR
jgi:hypothetical protein